MPLQAGKLRTRLRLQTSTLTKDTYGADVVAWTHVSKIWGGVRPFTGREFFEAQATTTEVSSEVIIRYRKFVHANKRFLQPKENTALAVAISTTNQTSLSLDDTGIFFGADGDAFILEVGDEQMIVTYVVSTDTATIGTRGAFGTTANTHVVDSVVTRLTPLEIVSVMNVDDKREMFKLACKETVI